MTRFYIHLKNGEGFVADPEGKLLSNLEAARREALKTAGEIIAEELLAGCHVVQLTLYVEDGSGERLLTIPVETVVQA